MKVSHLFDCHINSQHLVSCNFTRCIFKLKHVMTFTDSKMSAVITTTKTCVLLAESGKAKNLTTTQNLTKLEYVCRVG